MTTIVSSRHWPALSNAASAAEILVTPDVNDVRSSPTAAINNAPMSITPSPLPTTPRLDAASAVAIQLDDHSRTPSAFGRRVASLIHPNDPRAEMVFRVTGIQAHGAYDTARAMKEHEAALALDPNAFFDRSEMWAASLRANYQYDLETGTTTETPEQLEKRIEWLRASEERRRLEALGQLPKLESAPDTSPGVYHGAEPTPEFLARLKGIYGEDKVRVVRTPDEIQIWVGDHKSLPDDVPSELAFAESPPPAPTIFISKSPAAQIALSIQQDIAELEDAIASV